jgi:hypothetical protein
MIIIRFQGGIGNQMFDYALYRQLQINGKEVKADLSTFHDAKEIRSFKLQEAFGVKLDVASDWEIFCLAGGSNSFFKRVVRKLFKQKNLYTEERIGSVENFYQMETGFANGYWQSEKWFPDVADLLKKEFVFQKTRPELEELCSRVSQEASVSIHVRMGDYIQHADLYGGICTLEYYQKAIDYIREKVENPVFYVISDEPDKAKAMLGDSVQAEYIQNEIDYEDMQFMSNCRHNILANSSFSWWSTYLNQHEDKFVVAPSRWNNFEDCTNVYVKEWHVI